MSILKNLLYYEEEKKKTSTFMVISIMAKNKIGARPKKS